MEKMQELAGAEGIKSALGYQMEGLIPIGERLDKAIAEQENKLRQMKELKELFEKTPDILQTIELLKTVGIFW